MVLALVASMAGARVSAAADRVEVLVIGNNQAFVDGGAAPSDSALPTLRFADDDAAAFYQLVSAIADTSHLLTLMDADTQSLYPELTAVARPPTVAELRAAVAALATRIEQNRAHGDRSVLYIFFSGHGSIVEGKGPTLALLDGGISHELLYDEVLGKLPADLVHLFVDACHAEAVVRPRDTQARAVSLTPAEADAFLVHSTLARFPHVGAIVAASTDALTHEWDQLGHGVFTHELLSALRGAADVNRDGRIEYSEIYAFLGAANRGIQDPRARLSVVARPPDVDRHVAVLDLSKLPAGKVARLRGLPAAAGLVYVEDGVGRSLATFRAEPGFVADLVLPAGTTYVRAGDKEARFEGHPGDIVTFGSLGFRAPRERARGSLGDAVQRGLFATEFGRGYYRGFIDQAPDFVPVAFSVDEVASHRSEPAAGSAVDAAASTPARRLVVGIGAASSVADELGASEALRVGVRPGARSGALLSLDLARAAAPGIAEWRTMVSAGWLWGTRLGAAQGWLGASAGGGTVVQTATGVPSRWSGVVAGGPVVGGAIDVTHRLGFWGEAQLQGVAFRLDDRTAFSIDPSAFLGLSLGL